MKAAQVIKANMPMATPYSITVIPAQFFRFPQIILSFLLVGGERIQYVPANPYLLLLLLSFLPFRFHDSLCDDRFQPERISPIEVMEDRSTVLCRRAFPNDCGGHRQGFLMRQG